MRVETGQQAEVTFIAGLSEIKVILDLKLSEIEINNILSLHTHLPNSDFPSWQIYLGTLREGRFTAGAVNSETYF